MSSNLFCAAKIAVNVVIFLALTLVTPAGTILQGAAAVAKEPLPEPAEARPAKDDTELRAWLESMAWRKRTATKSSSRPLQSRTTRRGDAGSFTPGSRSTESGATLLVPVFTRIRSSPTVRPGKRASFADESHFSKGPIFAANYGEFPGS